jgi:hypothetical protein
MVEDAGFIDFLQDLNFSKVGSWELINGEMNYSIKKESNTSVYLWVAETEDFKIIPLYVGKAGTSLNKRMNEHLNGFKERNSRKKKCEVLKSLLEQKVKVDIFARESLIFDSKKITELDLLFPNCKFKTLPILSTESIEEKILIELIKTKFNTKNLLPLNYMSDKTKKEIETNYQIFVIN